MSEKEESAKKRGWWPVIVAAVIGAVATLGAALIANGAGAIDIVTGSGAAPTVTITPEAAPTITVTASPVPTAPGPVILPDCSASQQCVAWNLVARLTPNGDTGIDFAKGSVQLNGGGDLIYQTSQDGTPQLVKNDAGAYSTAVTARNASRATCQASAASAPDSNAIVTFHKGLFFCVATGASGTGTALVEETEPLGSNDVLYLRELYWPDSSAG